jgi:ABC-type nitrate/sulfonate/bicarbonate transport system permease component
MRKQRSAAAGPKAKALGLGIGGIILFFLIWEATPLPPASEVLVRLGQYFTEAAFWKDVADTMTSWALGLFIATVAAIIIGLIIGSSRFLRRATHTTIEFLRPIPSVALIPLAVLTFGTSIESTLLLVVYASFWQVLLQLLYGIADVDAVANDTAKSYGLGRLARVRYVIWPTALPYLMTGLRLAAAVALILAITAELIIGTPGLGKQIALTQSGGAISSMYALVLATGMIGVLINLAARIIEKRVLSWHPSVRGEVVL